jgi:hypothetical protein
MSEKNTFDPTNSTLTIHFDNPQAARYFKLFLSRIGEQEYFEFMNAREFDDKSPSITATRFHYHGGSEILTVCGRMDGTE